VYFSMFIRFPSACRHHPFRHDNGIFIGFPRAALTFLNQPLVVAIIFQACRRCGHLVPKRKSLSAISPG